VAATIDSSLGEELLALLRAAQWPQVLAFFERELTREEKAEAAYRLPYAIALICTGRTGTGIKMVDDEVAGLADARLYIRRFAIPFLIKEGRIELAIQLLDRLLQADPENTDDLRLRGSLHGRLKRFDEAIRDSGAVARRLSDDMSAQSSYLQGLLQAGRIDEAGSYAESLGTKATGHPRAAAMVLLALTRSGRMEAAADLAIEASMQDIADEGLAGAIVRTLFDAGQFENAVEVGERLLADGWDHPVLRSNLGQAYMATQTDDRYERAIAHLREGLDLEPGDARMNAAIGEAMLRTRSYEAAIPFLERACEAQPKAAQARALYARALKQAGRYDDAAREFRQLLKMQPSSPRWQRYAAGALSQAGRKREAVEVFDKFVSERRATLPKRFEDGLEALWDKIDTVNIPKARLDWAWSLSDQRINDRAEWERRAKWGHLADHYLLDWLECRDQKVHEAMARLADLSDAEHILNSIDRSKGAVLASAHIGPMYAGPLALELMGIESRWLASTPSVARTAYASSLISTSDQDDREVARAFMLSLRKGYSVVAAVDGAINLAAPRIAFERQEMTYSSFAARTAHRLEIPSVFCAPRWEEGRIGFVIEQMPDPLPDESADSHAERWRMAFLDALRRYLGGAPENLRLSGGLWRHIR
jgi:tetratricopeptide (TPR) repeat protein